MRDILDRALGWSSRHRRRLKKYGLGVSLFLFGGGLAFALWHAPEAWTRINPIPFAILVFLGVPIGVSLNTAEFSVMARYADKRISWRAALEVTIYTTAANMLPLPGGALVRIAALKTQGSTYQIGTILIILFSGLSGSMAFLYAGGWLIILGQSLIGILFCSAGLFGLVACGIFGARIKSQWPPALVAFLIRLALLLLATVRMILGTMAFGANIDFGQASVYVVAAFIGTAIAIVPAGLGISETMMALLSPLVSVDAATGFIGAAISRLATMAGLGIICVLALIAPPRVARRCTPTPPTLR